MSSKSHEENDVGQILKASGIEGQRLEHNEPGSREALMEQAQALLIALESPLESVFGFTLAEVSYPVFNLSILTIGLTARSQFRC